MIHRPETVTTVGVLEGRARFFTPQISLQYSGGEFEPKSVFDSWGGGSKSGWNKELEIVVGNITGMKRFEIGEAVVGHSNWRVMKVWKRMRTVEI